MPERRNRIKTLFLIESLSGGGAEKVLSVLLKHLDREKFDVTLCLVNDVGVYKDEVRPYVRLCSILPDPAGLSGLKFILYKLKYKLFYYWLPAKWVYSLFVPKGADVEVAFTEGFATKLISASTSRSSKKISWLHTDLKANHWPLAEGVFKDLNEEKECYELFDRVVAVSSTVKDSFISLFSGDITVEVLHNPVDPDEIIQKSQEKSDLTWSGHKKSFRLVSVGRLVPQKGYDRLVRVCGKLLRAGFDYEVFVLGEGGQRKDLESLVRSEGLEGRVHFPGFLLNPFTIVADADLFVCPSRSEGYSTAVTEALILGVPIIATDCSGMCELLGRSYGGVITPNDESGFYQGLKGLLENEKSLSDLKAEAKMKKDCFIISALMAPIEEMLLSC